MLIQYIRNPPTKIKLEVFFVPTDTENTGFLRPNTVACVVGIISHICKIFTYFLHGVNFLLALKIKKPYNLRRIGA